MKDAFIRDLLATRYRPDELPRRRLAFMGLPETPSVQALSIALVRSDVAARREEREWQLLRFGTGNIIRETVAAGLDGMPGLAAEAVDVSDQHFVVVFTAGTAPDEREKTRIEELSNAIVGHILQYMRLSVLAGLGTVRAGWHGLIDSYLESKRAVEIAEMNEWNRVYRFAEESRSERDTHVPMETVKELHDAIYLKQWQLARELWRSLGGALASCAAPLPVRSEERRVGKECRL